MKLSGFQRVEIPADTDEWEREKRFAIRNSGFTRRPGLATRWVRAINADNNELVMTVRKAQGRLVLEGIEIVEGGEHDEPDA
jgi:hypothetical protein